MTDQLIKRRIRVKKLMIQACADGYFQKAMQAQSILWQIDKRMSEQMHTNFTNRLKQISA